MNDNLREQIYTSLNQKGNEELIEIWQTNNRAEWTDMAFDVMRQILEERHIELPPPVEPVIETGKTAVIDDTHMSVMQIYFSFNGRIGRSTYWLWGVLPIVWFITVIGYLDAIIFSDSSNEGILILLSRIIFLWPSLALTIKRWHDLDKSGWWILIGLIPIVGGIWALIETCFHSGTKGPNQYGAKSF